MGKKKYEQSDIQICKGIAISKSIYEEKENRLLTLLAKGFIVYLLTMGSIGFYLSAFDIKYNEVLCHVVIFVMAMLCAMLYYRLLVENLGYLILFIAFAGLVIMFNKVINSGFYAIVNITVDQAAKYFDVDVQRLYTEQITNRYLTVTCVVVFIGIVLDIFLNVYISRRMQYVTAFMVVMSLNLIPLYMICEPDYIYVVMMIGGMAMAYCFRSGKHYSPQVAIRRNSSVFAEKKKKNRGRNDKKCGEIGYVYDVKAVSQMLVIAIAFVMAITFGARLIRPIENFNTGYKENKYKEISMAAVSTFMVNGISGFFDRGSDTAGMDSGRLGDVGSVKLDYQTDIIVKYTPYSYDTLYLKSFVGVSYNPYQNSWTSIDDLKGYNANLTSEANALSRAYEEGKDNTAKGNMEINVIDPGQGLFYYPYYTKEVTQGKNGFYDVLYYPYQIGTYIKTDPLDYEGQEYTDMDLYIPEENYESVRKFVNSLSSLGDCEEMTMQISSYFQDNYPYTIKPGKTPRKEDFINYFLDENKKGYCTHFASAAVLAFRYVGIPARYVEGYAISANEMLDGELVEGADYNDYFEGYSSIGETALVQINVTDADAHAWVEIYDTERGWYPVDVTPVSEQEEEENESFWEMYDKIMEGDDTSDEDVAGLNNGANIANNVLMIIGRVIICIFGIFILILVAIKGKRVIIDLVKFAKAGKNDRLVIRYAKKYKKLSKKNPKLKECRNYRKQIENITEEISDEDRENIILILEKAGFSNREITDGEYEFALNMIKKL